MYQMLLVPWKNIVPSRNVKGQRLCVIVLRERFSIACPENQV